MEIFVLSMHRCGTQSVHDFLLKSGFRSGHNPSGRSSLNFQHLWDGHYTNLNHVFNSLVENASPHFNAISDNPMAALYEQAYQNFPQAKFILATRNPKDWVHSVRSHIGEREMVAAEKIQYWRFTDKRPNYITELSDIELCDIFENHQSLTRSFFKNNNAQKQLCVINLNESDGTKNSLLLSNFLSVPPQIFGHIDPKKANKPSCFQFNHRV